MATMDDDFFSGFNQLGSDEDEDVSPQALPQFPTSFHSKDKCAEVRESVVD
jgi:hypothetical protein